MAGRHQSGRHVIKHIDSTFILAAAISRPRGLSAWCCQQPPPEMRPLPEYPNECGVCAPAAVFTVTAPLDSAGRSPITRPEQSCIRLAGLHHPRRPRLGPTHVPSHAIGPAQQTTQAVTAGCLPNVLAPSQSTGSNLKTCSASAAGRPAGLPGSISPRGFARLLPAARARPSLGCVPRNCFFSLRQCATLEKKALSLFIILCHLSLWHRISSASLAVMHVPV